MELRRFLLLGFGLAGSTLLCCAALDEPPHLAMDDAIAVNEPIGGDDLSRDAGTVFSSPGLLSRLSQLLIGGRPQVDGDNLANFMFENNGATPGVDGALRESPKDAILDEYMTRRLHSAPANVKDALKEVSHVAKHVNKAAHITKRHEAKTHHQTILKSPRRRPSRQSPRPHSSRQSDHNPTHNSSNFSEIGQGWCLDASNEWYSFVSSPLLIGRTADTYCLNWCSQIPHKDLVAVEVSRDYSYVQCLCDFTGGVPNDVNLTDYAPAAEFYHDYYGVGAVQTSNGNSGAVCYRNDNFKNSYPASAVKIELKTGKNINMFEVEAIANTGYNVAAGKPSNQSSTFKGFNASLAVDGKPNTFSLTDVAAQTAGSPVWWEVDLGNEFRIESVNIKNRWCKTSTDPDGCLCRLSNATLALLDGQGTVVATQSVGNACGQHELSLMDFIPVDLPTDGDDYYYDDYYYDDYFSSVPTSSYEPTSSPGPSSSPVVGFSRDGAGYCVNALNEWYSYVGSPYLPNDTTDTYCLHWCSQIPHPELVGVEVFREYWGVECICDFAGGIPNDISLTDYTPAAIFNDTFNGVGAIQTSDGVSYVVCYRNDNFKLPASKPTKRPTKKPTSKPTNKTPTKKPTKQPTKRPTKKPTSKPTNAPTNKPTTFPTKKPTSKPTISPTKRPTTSPTKKATSKTSKVTN